MAKKNLIQSFMVFDDSQYHREEFSKILFFSRFAVMLWVIEYRKTIYCLFFRIVNGFEDIYNNT